EVSLVSAGALARELLAARPRARARAPTPGAELVPRSRAPRRLPRLGAPLPPHRADLGDLRPRRRPAPRRRGGHGGARGAPPGGGRRAARGARPVWLRAARRRAASPADAQLAAAARARGVARRGRAAPP